MRGTSAWTSHATHEALARLFGSIGLSAVLSFQVLAIVCYLPVAERDSPMVVDESAGVRTVAEPGATGTRGLTEFVLDSRWYSIALATGLWGCAFHLLVLIAAVVILLANLFHRDRHRPPPGQGDDRHHHDSATTACWLCLALAKGTLVISFACVLGGGIEGPSYAGRAHLMCAEAAATALLLWDMLCALGSYGLLSAGPSVPHPPTAA